VNTAFAELVMEVGVDAVVDVASRLGIDPDRAFGPPETRGPSIALGGLTHGVAPVDPAGASAALLDGGGFNRPYLVERVTGPDGAERYRRQPDTVQAAVALSASCRGGCCAAWGLWGWAGPGRRAPTASCPAAPPRAA
jgi:penicillin-binding protein 1A